jgi:hypothetical protein
VHRNFSQWTHPIHALDPKLMFWCISHSFPYYTNFVAKKGKSSAINAQVRATLSCRNFLQRTHRIHPIGDETPVLGRFRPFGYCTNFHAKLAKLL